MYCTEETIVPANGYKSIIFLNTDMNQTVRNYTPSQTGDYLVFGIRSSIITAQDSSTRSYLIFGSFNVHSTDSTVYPNYYGINARVFNHSNSPITVETTDRVQVMFVKRNHISYVYGS